MASCIRNIRTKIYQNLVIGFQVTVENVGDVFWDTVYIIQNRASLEFNYTDWTLVIALQAHAQFLGLQ